MSREIRRVPVDWQHPTEPNPYWRGQQESRQRRGDPEPRLHAPEVRFRALHSRDILDYYEPGDELPDEGDLMPDFGADLHELGWCLYQTVSEGAPITPVFATADELVDHLSTQGDDWTQEPWRRAAAEAMVRTGTSFGSFVHVPGEGMLDGARDLDRLTPSAKPCSCGRAYRVADSQREGYYFEPLTDERQEGPHSRSCGIAKHDHGTACRPDCPTCHGRTDASDERAS